MRGRVSIFFVFLYVAALLKPAQPFLEYYLDYDYFATILCINKDNPEMGCNGQCELSKRLKAAQEEPSAPALPSTTNSSLRDYPIGFVCTWQFQLALISEPVNHPNWFPVAAVRTGLSDIFHPPS
jgi:hypothetical protein